MSYSLDDGEQISFNRNMTLANMTFGSHELTIFANDTLGKLVSSETINFTIAKPPEPFSTALTIAASLAKVILVSAGLLLYFTKRKH